ncbi:MAG: orotate phosphoribosyltransferase [Actinomycetota bacterium]|nr:orotate phosphoribosyltransferase [Actinomycetota bacterium]
MALDDATRHRVAQLVREQGYERREEPFRLTSGGLSHDYVDGKHAIATGAGLALVCQAVIDVVGEPFDSVGGPTMGADAMAHGVALLSGRGWFSVRKEPKGHGRHSWVEGTRLAEGDRVVFVEDVVSTGASLLRAVDRVVDLGVTIVAAVTLLDRSQAAGRLFEQRAIRYLPLLTSADIGIAPLT